MFRIATVAFVVVIFERALGQDTTIRYITKSEVLNPGKNVNLTCEYYVKMGTVHRRWVKNNGKGIFQDISLNDVIQTKDDRYSVHTYQSRGRDAKNYRMYTLMINNVNFNDNGTFECRIYLDNGRLLSKNTSIVIFPSEKLYKVALEGDDVHLECFNNDYIMSDVKWTNKHRTSLPNGSVTDRNLLIIPSLGLDNSGLYSCSARCKVSNQTNSVSQEIVLDVVPPLDVQVRNQMMIRPLGYNVNLTCFIYSTTLVGVAWTKDKKVVMQGPRHQMLLYYSQGDGLKKKSVIVSQLNIKSITKDDYGDYICDVENNFTYMSKGIHLKPTVTGPGHTMSLSKIPP